jgi:hypothetical protein
MPWIGNLFKKWNYPGGWTADATSSIGIEAGRHDTQDSDFADGINACLKKDATNAGFTTNLDFNGYRPTNLAAGSEAAPAICLNNDSDTGVWAPAANVLAISTGGAERIRFNAAGETVTTGTISCNQTSGYPTVAVKSVQAAGYAPGFLEMRRSGASSTATPDNSVLGEIRFTGLNPSASYMNCATITAQIGTNAAGGAPCDLIFWTAPSWNRDCKSVLPIAACF